MKSQSSVRVTSCVLCCLLLGAISLAAPPSALKVERRDWRIARRDGRFKVVDAFDRRAGYASARAADGLQWAIDQAAGAGAEVRLCSGTFPLERPVRLRAKVVLAGAGTGSILLPAESFSGNALLVAEQADGFSIERLSVRGRNTLGLDGIVLKRCGEARLVDVSVYRCGGYGIVIADGCLMTLTSQCVMAGNAKGGMLLRNLTTENRNANYPPNRVLACRVYRGGSGYECDHAILVDFTACTAFQTTGPAFHLHRISNSVLLTGCRAFQTSADAVLLEDSQELNLTGNIFCWQTGHGIRVKNGTWGTISGNEIIDSGSWNPGRPDSTTTFSNWNNRIVRADAIVLEGCKGFTLSANAVFSWPVAPPPDYGIREDAASSYNLIAGNMVNYVAKQAILSEGKDSVVGTNCVVEKVGLLRGKPFDAEKMIQSFQPELMDAYIDKLIE